MVYTWGYNEFVKQTKALQKLIEEEKDFKRKMYLQKVADTTDKLFHDTFNPFTPPKVTAKQRFSAILGSRLTYGRYYSIVSDFLERCIDQLEFIDDISTKLEEIDENGNFDFLHTGAVVSHTKTLSLVDKFYSEFDDELYQVFSSVYKDRHHNLRFINPEDNKDTKSNGTTLFIDGVKANFISICDIGNVDNYGCCVHEYGHSLQNMINPEVSYSDREDLFMEVASIFPELVAMYENKGKLDETEVAYYLYTTITENLNSAEFLTLHTPLVNAWADHKYVMSNKFFDEIDETYDIDEECFEKALATTIEDEGVYVLSLIVSLELFHIYKQDKRKALELFKKFLTFPAKEDILTFVLEHFSLNEHANEEIEIMLKDFNKKLEKRRI